MKGERQALDPTVQVSTKIVNHPLANPDCCAVVQEAQTAQQDVNND
jgi:hypothetical protein